MRPAALAALLAGCAAAGPIRIESAGEPTRVVVSAPGPGGLRLARVDEATGREGPALLGESAEADGTVRFVPSHPLAPGARYRATLSRPGRPDEVLDHRVPSRPPAAAAVVERIYPSPDRLPANLLKFYLHFSRPMREEREVFERIRLVRDDGVEVPDPWRHVELWSEDARRLTLFIHPGRIKLGVALREAMGPVLEPGRTYVLEAGGDLLDQEGRPLAALFRKRFLALPDDRERPSVASWRIEAPRAGGREPLRASFPEPLDRWLLARMLTVAGPDGRPVPGALEVGPEERAVTFVPETPWTAGAHELRVHEDLEDLAGNTPARLFEEPAGAPPSPPADLCRSFEVR